MKAISMDYRQFLNNMLLIYRFDIIICLNPKRKKTATLNEQSGSFVWEQQGSNL